MSSGWLPKHRQLFFPIFQEGPKEKIMPQEEDDKIAALLKTMLKKRLYVALSKAVARPEQTLPFVAEHLEYMNQLQNEGKLFASGPFIQEGVLVGDGSTILQTSSNPISSIASRIRPQPACFVG
jgi:hypothetical protein